MTDPVGLTVGQVVERTGVSAATLRIWEQRHGFPNPERAANGHRRYSEEDVDLLKEVLREREAGVSIGAAVERARTTRALPHHSIYAGLRARQPGLTPRRFEKRTVVAMTHALEDECMARGERPILVGSFQRERFYRHAESRWSTLAESAEVAIAFADFAGFAERPGAPVEVPLARTHPLAREWAIVCCAPRYTACLAAFEPGVDQPIDDRRRVFETIWSTRPQVVHAAVEVAASLTADSSPRVAKQIRARLGRQAPAADDADAVRALADRMLAYVSAV